MKETISKIKSFIIRCKRVWHVLRKPTKEEFKQVSTISALGILLIGLFGFILSIIVKFLFR